MKKNKLNILIVGVANLGNLGQRSMVSCCVQELSKIFPMAFFNIFSYDAKLDEKRFTYPNVVIHEHFFTKISRLKFGYIALLFVFVVQLLSVFLWKLFKTKFFLNDFLKKYLESDVVIDLSGDSITDDYGWMITIMQLYGVLIGYFFNKPTVICAQTLGPFRKRVWGVNITEEFAKFVFKRVSLITVRDEITKNYCDSLKLQKSVILTSDLAFLLQPSGQERIKEICQIEGVSVRERPIVGFSPSCIIHYYSDFGANNTEKQQRYIKLCADFITHAIENFNINVVLFPHVKATGVDDCFVCSEIVGLLQDTNKKYIEIIEGTYTPEELKGIMNMCNLFVGCRMHSTIASISLGMPTLSIAYSNKTIGVIGKSFGEEFIVDIRKKTPSEFLDELTSKFEYLWNNQNVLKVLINKEMKFIKMKSLENINLITKLFNM